MPRRLHASVAVVALLAVLLTGRAVVAAPLPPRSSAAEPLPYKGMTFTNERYCPLVSLGSEVAADSLRHLETTGANAVSIVVTQYQQNTSSTTIAPIPAGSMVNCTTTPNGYCSTATDAELSAAITLAQSLGMRVMLKLQIDLLDAPGLWRGDIGVNMTQRAWWDAWFASYGNAILHYAKIAELLEVHMLSVSCELVEASKQESHWRGLIVQLRSVYSGILIDSANWSPPGAPATGTGEVTDKMWWDAVDAIGVDEYYMTWSNSHELANDTFRTKEDLLSLWEPIESQLDALHRRWNRSVVFTEIGVCAGLNGTCFDNLPASQVPIVSTTNASLQAQATQFDAALTAMSKHPWFLGVFWWNWATDAAFGGDDNACMDPKFKPAEQVLRLWYNATKPAPPPPNYTVTCRCWL